MAVEESKGFDDLSWLPKEGIAVVGIVGNIASKREMACLSLWRLTMQLPLMTVVRREIYASARC